ncbi:peptidylprolyl isomerase [archaeon]|jgi:FKBP-type peptidyl-prolyl cis-trans isomerase 2|nr:peptidylprolyl isomerase [archaeon]
MALKKKDFIEIEFTAKTKDGMIFDSNVKADLEKAEIQGQAKPFTFSLGQGMFLEGVDEFLEGKEIGEYDLELSPEKAFGKRDPKLIQMVPLKIFHAQQIRPVPGAVFNFDGKLAKVLSVSGGRILVDFNNPIAGKDVLYHVKILRKVDDVKEKVNALNDFFFRTEFKFEVKEKKLILELPEQMKVVAEMFKQKYKDILDLEVEAKIVEPKVEGKKEVKKE